MIESAKVPGKSRVTRHTAQSESLQLNAKKFWKDNKLVPSNGRYNLTISEDPKFIWFRNAKVGTRTIFSTLDGSGIKLTSDSLFNCYYFPQEYKKHFKFAFVRNPWDRFVSGWLNKVVRRNAFDFDPETRTHLSIFDNFVSYCSEQDLRTWNSHFRYQQRLMDLNSLDYLGRHENFEADFMEILRILDIPIAEIPTENKTRNRKHYSSYYSDDSKKMIGDMYQKDIQIFGYQFDDRRS